MKILFLQTGGTIDKDYPRLTRGYAFEITEPAVNRIMGKTSPVLEFEVKSILQKDSLELTDDDRTKILSACKIAEEERIIITHGTDTMIETARFLSAINNKVIIITGAMRPERFSDSDADFNIGVAVGAIQLLDYGVYIAMNGRIYASDKVKRNTNTGQFIAFD